MWLDFTKLGTLQPDDLDELLEELRRLLAAYPNRAAGLIVSPYMTSTKVVAGKRGEQRRVQLSTYVKINDTDSLPTFWVVT